MAWSIPVGGILTGIGSYYMLQARNDRKFEESIMNTPWYDIHQLSHIIPPHPHAATTQNLTNNTPTNNTPIIPSTTFSSPSSTSRPSINSSNNTSTVITPSTSSTAPTSTTTTSSPNPFLTSNVVKVQGKVYASSPFECVFAQGVKGAIYERSYLGQWFSFDEFERSTYIIRKQRQHVPFYLHQAQNDASREQAAKIHIVPWKEHPELTIVHEHTEEGRSMFLSFALGLFGIPYPYKYIQQEAVLHNDTTLFAMGKVYRDRDGRVMLKEPVSRSLFNPSHGIITQRSEEEVLDSLRESARANQLRGVTFLVPGVVLLARGLFSE